MDFMSIFRPQPPTPPEPPRLSPIPAIDVTPTPVQRPMLADAEPVTVAVSKTASRPPAIAAPAGAGDAFSAIGRRPKTPVQQHARAFVAWMADSAYGIEGVPDHETGVWRWIERDGRLYAEMLQSDLLGAYADMCAEMDLEPHAWNTLACELREFLGEHKRYARVPGENGVTFRRRCYHIPVERRTKLPYPEPRPSTDSAARDTPPPPIIDDIQPERLAA